jgi:hypothetical protein
MIDQASVFAERFKGNPQVLQATVLGQGNIPGLDPYTALNALKLIKESQRMEMAGRAQQPTSSPSIVAETLAPTPMQQGLGAMVPGAMGGQGMPPQGMPPQGMPPQGMPPQQRASMPQPTMQAASGGLAGMYTPEEDFAEGGIVAFQDRGYVNPDLTEGMSTPAVSASSFDDYIASMTGGGTPSSTAISRAQEALEKYMAFEPTEMSAKEQEAFLDRYMARVEKAAGPNIYAPAKEELKARREALTGDRRFGEGMAYLTAAGKVLEGRNLAEGASKAAPAFAQQLGEARRAEQQEKRAIEQMNFALNDAERKERMGNQRGAQAALAEARKFQQDANRAHGDKLRFAADIAARTVGYSKVNKAAGSGDASTKLPQVDREAAQITKQIIALEAKDPNDPQIAVLRKQREGLLEILATGKDYGPTKAGSEEAKLTETTESNLDKDVNKQAIFDPAYQKAMAAGDSQGMSDAKLAIRRRIIANRQATSGKPSGDGVNKNSTTAPDISTIKGAPAGSTIGKQTAKGWEVLGPSGTLIGYAQK